MNKLIRHVMLDFETLGTAHDTVVLSLGAVVFDRETIFLEQEWVIGIQDQLKAKFSINGDTLLWWMDQGEKARQIFNRNKAEGLGLREFVNSFSAFAQGCSDCRVWGNGALFDVAIVESILNRGGAKIPWNFSRVRCYRTVKAMHKIEKDQVRIGTHHDALDDAKFQTQCLQRFLNANPECDQ